MNKSKLLLIFFLISFNSLLFSQQFNMILTGDPVIEDIHYLSVASGKSFLSFSSPLSPYEIRNFLNSIDESSLSPSAKEAYSRIEKRLTPEKQPLSLALDDIFSFILNINASVEGKARTNNDISWYPRYPENLPLLSFPLQLFFSNIAQLYIEPTIGLRYRDQSSDNFDSNIPLGAEHFNVQFWPIRSFAAFGGSFWNFQIGRDRLFFGTGHTGSLSFSNNSTFFDFTRLSLFSPHVKYSLMIIQMPLKISDNLFPENFIDWNSADVTETTQRYFYLHCLDISLFNKFSINLMEGVLVGNAPIELKYLNPLILFHSLYSWTDYETWNPGKYNGSGHMVGSFFSLEINYNIIKNLSLYGQFVMNQFALPGEIENGDQAPNGLAYMLGINFTHSFNLWGSIFYLEFIYTDPYFQILATPFGSFIQMEHENYYLIGYPRDTISLSLGTEFFLKDTLRLSGIFSWILSGVRSKDLWDWENTNIHRTPSGIAENKFIISLGADWKPVLNLTLSANVTGIYSHNNKNISGKNNAGAQFTLSANYKF